MNTTTITLKGDHRGADPDHLYGPDRRGRRLKLDRVEYDEQTDRSTLVLRPVPPPEFRDTLESLAPQAQAHFRIGALFNA